MEGAATPSSRERLAPTKRRAHALHWLLPLLAGLMSSCGQSGGSSSRAAIDDADFDGVSDTDEAVLGTDPFDRDSDDDGLDDGAERKHRTLPLDPDSDDDALLDGFEVDAGTNALAADAVTWLSGTVRQPDGTPSFGATVELDNDTVDKAYAGLSVATDVDGSFAFTQPWPTALRQDAVITAAAALDGTTYSATQSLPLLPPGNFELQPIELAFQPYMRGTDFFVAMPYLGRSMIPVMALMNAGDRRAHITWTVPGLPSSVPGASGSVDLEPDDATVVSLPGDELVHRQGDANRIEFLSRGVRIRSDRPISVAIHSYSASSDFGATSFACTPTSSFGTRYYLQTFGTGQAFQERGALGFFTAGHEDVLLGLTLAAPLEILESGTPRLIPAGVPTAVSLAYEHTLQCIANGGGQDLTGSFVESDRPIGVLAGTTSLTEDELGGLTYGAVATLPLAPTSQWGLEFVTFGNIGDLDSRVYVIAGETGADVSIGGAPPITLLAGEPYSFKLDPADATTIVSDRPILAWQLCGWFWVGAVGIHLAPVERWTTKEVLWAFDPPGTDTSLAILFHSASELRVDGVLADTLPLAVISSINSTYSLLIAPTTAGKHQIDSTEPMFPMVLGESEPGFAYPYAYSTTW